MAKASFILFSSKKSWENLFASPVSEFDVFRDGGPRSNSIKLKGCN